MSNPVSLLYQVFRFSKCLSLSHLRLPLLGEPDILSDAPHTTMFLPVQFLFHHPPFYRTPSMAVPVSRARFSFFLSILFFPNPGNSLAYSFAVVSYGTSDDKNVFANIIFLLLLFCFCPAENHASHFASVLMVANLNRILDLFPSVFYFSHWSFHKNPIPLYKIYFPRLHLFIPEARLFSSFSKSSWFAFEILFGI